MVTLLLQPLIYGVCIIPEEFLSLDDIPLPLHPGDVPLQAEVPPDAGHILGGEPQGGAEVVPAVPHVTDEGEGFPAGF